jgi:3-hydroxyacyl-CoA dehydrogenase
MISLMLHFLLRMGPLHLADYIGLDTCLFIVEGKKDIGFEIHRSFVSFIGAMLISQFTNHVVLGWVKDFPDEKAFVVPNILKQKVERNELGRKTGKGFYLWSGDKRGDPVE